MPLAPAPIFPGTSPLPTPGFRPPSRGASRVAALIALPMLLALLVIGQVTLPWVAFVAPGLESQAGGSDPGAQAAPFQGFVYQWTRRMPSGANAGFTSPASLANLKLEAQTFHMNAVIIPVIADMPYRDDSIISWNASDPTSGKYDLDTFPDSTYAQVIQDVRSVGLLPVLELEIRQQSPLSKTAAGIDESPELVGRAWDAPSSQSYGAEFGTGVRLNIRDTERGWFDSYTAFAVHYAELSAKYNLPYFIIGDDLSSVTTDDSHTSRKGDPGGIDSGLTTDPFINTCTGRHDCGWRHIINAIKSPTYGTYIGNKPSVGASYSGKLIYAASWGPTGDPEYVGITWWDAVDYIGIDAYFPLSAGLSDIGMQDLSDIWHGQGTNVSPAGDIYDSIGKNSDQFFRPVLFTAAGYESTVASNASPGSTAPSDVDQTEQLNDMQALQFTFNSAPWWVGVFWYADEPQTPHSSQTNWTTGTAWAGDTLGSSKLAGQWLAHYYAAQSFTM